MFAAWQSGGLGLNRERWLSGNSDEASNTG